MSYTNNNYHIEDSQSEDSLLKEIHKRQNQRKLNQYLNDSIRDDQPPIQTHHHDYFKPHNNNYPGFSNANQFFNSDKKLKQIPKKSLRLIDDNQNAQSTSTITIPHGQKEQQSDLLENKQAPKPILKDIQQIGDNCGNCKPKPKLDYTQRNKRLIKQHQKKVYQQKNQNQEQQQEQKKQTSIKNNFNFQQFKYNQKDNSKNISNLLIPPSIHSLDPSKKFHFLIQKSKIQSQKQLKIQGHNVYFPYQPYEAQIKYMSQVLQSLDKSKNAILQSPTGTGKTLCLLSATLSWVQEQFLKTYKEVSIIYLSRTHSQLAQVQKQLQKTCFRPTMATFGSREIFCIKEQFSQLKGRQKVEACSKGVKLYLKFGKQKAKRQLKFDQQQEEKPTNNYLSSSKKKLKDFPPQQQQKMQQAMCHYYKGQGYVLDLARNKFKNKLISTQKMKQLGKTYSFCPYYYPTFIKPICNLFLMPYNYLLDDDLNQKYKDLIKESILIFDQAHNVPQSSCDGRSYTINKKTFQDAKKQLTKLIKGQKMSEQLKIVKDTHGENELKGIQQQVDRIFGRINNFVTQVEYPQDQRIAEDDITQKKLFSQHQTEQKIYQLLYQRCYDHEKTIFKSLPQDLNKRDLIKQMAKSIQKDIQALSSLCQALQQTPDGIFQNMQKVATFVKKCIRLLLQQPNSFPWVQRQINHYRLVIRKVDKHWQIDMVCLVPFLTMKNIVDMQPRNIILTSGTLSPLDTWQNQLGIEFPIKFSNNHVIGSNQLMLRVLMGQGKYCFNFSYKYLQQNFKTIYDFTLKSIIQLAQKIPNGILVITPSYKVMNSLERCMQYNPELRKRLNHAKKVFTQTKDSYQDLIKKYRKAAMEPKGALLFCVCRGKISQGIDFPNQLCRVVIFVGIPFPNVKDIIINEKKNHYDKISKQQRNYKFSGQKWYQNLTFRSVNQAIGRVIRHIYDFGSIFLLDLRYNLPRYKGQLPKWALPSLKSDDLTDQLMDELQEFYRNMQHQYGNYQGKKQLNNNKPNSFDSFDNQIQKPKIQKNQKSSQKQKQKTPQKIFQNQLKLQSKKPFANKYFIKPAQQQSQKKAPQNAFSAIMGTNQNKMKKKSSNIFKNPFSNS